MYRFRAIPLDFTHAYISISIYIYIYTGEIKKGKMIKFLIRNFKKKKQLSQT